MIASGQEQNAAKDGLVSMTERIMLGIESSCDDTSIAILKGQQLLGQFAAVQHIHSKYGGVVPEFASRAHQVHIVPVLEGALKEAGCSLRQIDGIAYTRGPGLHGSLLVGSAFARSSGLVAGGAHVPGAPHEGPCGGALDGRCSAQSQSAHDGPYGLRGSHPALGGALSHGHARHRDHHGRRCRRSI